MAPNANPAPSDGIDPEKNQFSSGKKISFQVEKYNFQRKFCHTSFHIANNPSGSHSCCIQITNCIDGHFNQILFNFCHSKNQNSGSIQFEQH